MAGCPKLSRCAPTTAVVVVGAVLGCSTSCFVVVVVVVGRQLPKKLQLQLLVPVGG